MAKHVRVDGEWQLGGLPDTLDEAVETDGTDRPTAFGNEHVSLSRVIAAQLEAPASRHRGLGGKSGHFLTAASCHDRTIHRSKTTLVLRMQPGGLFDVTEMK